MSTANVTRRLKAEGLPVEMVRGEGYHYFIFDEGDTYESHSIMVPRFRSMPMERWLEIGRQFAADVKAGTYDRMSTCY
jgi:hypothetical protein